jgi:hypothetical protein
VTTEQESAASLELGLAHFERAFQSKNADAIVENVAVGSYLVSAAFLICPTIIEAHSVDHPRPSDEFVDGLVSIVSGKVSEDLIRAAFTVLGQLLSIPEDGFNIDRQALIGLMGAELLAFHIRTFMEGRSALFAAAARRQDDTAQYPNTLQ